MPTENMYLLLDSLNKNAKYYTVFFSNIQNT